jgi:hypothetical protein
VYKLLIAPIFSAADLKIRPLNLSPTESILFLLGEVVWSLEKDAR